MQVADCLRRNCWDACGSHKEDTDCADQLNATLCETLAEPRRSNGYGKYFM